MLKALTEQAHPRAGLLGNPSDGYGGRAVAFPFLDFSARVTLEPADRFAIVPGPSDALEFACFRDACSALRERGCYGGVRLLRAATLRFGERHPQLAALAADDPRLRFRLRYESDIPQQVGLAGSSAIVVAALRALAAWFETPIAPAALAEIALAVELEELGIAAGPMDRVVQAYGEALYMDFREPRTAASYRPVDLATLPPLFIAWCPRPGMVSGGPHAQVRSRYERGDAEVVAAMQIFPKLADEGLACLERRDLDRLHALVDLNFDTRARIFPLSAADREMVEIGRSGGAAVKLCGSGGAVLGVLRHSDDFATVEERYRGAGYASLRPRLPTRARR